MDKESIEKRIEEVYMKQNFFEIADAKYIWMMFFGFKVKKEKILPFFEDGKISKSNLIENIIQYSSIAGTVNVSFHCLFFLSEDDFSIMSQLMDINHRGFYTEDCLAKLFHRNGEDPAEAKKIFRNLDLDGYGRISYSQLFEILHS
jgi:Ca2+-binding EF-hand superfamily protein